MAETLSLASLQWRMALQPHRRERYAPFWAHLWSEGGSGAVESTYLLDEPLDLAVNPGFSIQRIFPDRLP